MKSQAATAAVLSLWVLSGCVSNNAQKVAVGTPTAGDQNSVLIGLSPKLEPGGMYVHVSDAGGAWHVTQVSDKFLPPYEAVEVLWVSKDMLMVEPGYQAGRENSSPYISCSPLLLEYKGYHPCRSRLMVADTAGTIGRNLTAIPLTLGAGIGTNKIVDRELVARIITEAKVIEAVREQRNLVAAKQEIRDYIAKLRMEAVLKTSVQDTSGFALDENRLKPDIDVRLTFPGLESARTTDAARSMLIDLQQAVSNAGQIPQLKAECSLDRYTDIKGSAACDGGIVSDGRKLVIPATVQITAVSLRWTGPAKLDFGNVQIRGVLNGTILEVQNHSTGYLVVEAVSVYVNKDIRTTTLARPLTLPPMATQSISVESELNAMAHPVTMGATTLAQAKQRKTTYSIAVKYNVDGAQDSVVGTRTYTADQLGKP